MITAITSTRRLRCVAVSTPGGAARHFRVQYRRPEERVWRLSGSFCAADEAERSQCTLERDGYVTRMVPYRICPATM